MIKFRFFGFGRKGENTPQPDPSEVADAMGAINPNGKRVLLVDDDPVFLKATTMKLQSAGFQVTTAREGSEALAALGENPADAVLMDINFPPDVCNGGMGSWDGFQTMSWLRGLPSAQGARFIMVSNSDTPEYRTRARKLGAVAYFQKPVDPNALISAIDPNPAAAN